MKIKTTFFARMMRPLLATAAFASLVLSVQAAGYIKIGDIKGEATDNEHKDWINLLSISQSISRPMKSGISGSTRSRGDVVLGDIVCTKELDKSSPKLMEAVCKGTVIPKVEIHFTKNHTNADGSEGRVTYYAYELKNVMVTSYNVNGSAASDDPDPGSAAEKPMLTQVSLNYEEIKVTYDEIDQRTGASKGKVEATWKVEEGSN